MDRKIVYIVVGTLAVLVVVLGIELQHERDKTTGITIDLTHGLTFEPKNGG